MNYNLLAELRSLGVEAEVAERLYKLLKHIIKKPGKITINYTNEKKTRELKFDTEEFSGFLKYDIGYPEDSIQGRIVKKMDNNDSYFVNVSRGNYCTIHVVMSGEKAGIYEEMSTSIRYESKSEHVWQKYYDSETLKYLLSVDNNLSIILDSYYGIPVGYVLAKKGIEPDSFVEITGKDVSLGGKYGEDAYTDAASSIIFGDLANRVINNCSEKESKL